MAEASDENFLLTAYERITFIRAFEARVLELTAGDNPAIAGSVHLCAGQEAVPVGALRALRVDDRVLATYRGHGWALEAGLSPEAVLGEICQRSIGVNGGRAGSALMMGMGGQFVGENSIVGAGVPIGCGIAMAQKAQGSGAVTVVTIGDGAMNQGAVSEAMAFAAARELPLLIICENNGWAEMTPTASMMRIDRLARRASAYGIHAVTIDGTNPAIVRDTVALACEALRAGKGPAFIEARVPRLWGHYNRDVEHYRSKLDRSEAEGRDPLLGLRAKLMEISPRFESRMSEIDQKVLDEMRRIEGEVLASPLPSVVEVPVAQVPSTPAAQMQPAGQAKVMNYQNAVRSALHWSLSTIPGAVVYGEDVGVAGGIFGASRGLQKEFGSERVFDTPIAEAAILGSAVGASMAGMRPIVEIMWADFIFVALDQLVNQAANIRFLTGGAVTAPLVVRTQQGGTPGSCAQHSQCIEALLAHIPGLKVCLSATPQDAYDLLLSAISDDDPCVVIEARALYFDQAPVVEHGTPEPVGRARMRAEGDDALIVTWGAMTSLALEAAAAAEADGLRVAVLDLRWLAPLDMTTIFSAVKMTSGRVVILHEDNRTGGFGAEIAVRLHEEMGASYPLRIERVASDDVRLPSAPHLQKLVRPSIEKIMSALRSVTSKG